MQFQYCHHNYVPDFVAVMIYEFFSLHLWFWSGCRSITEKKLNQFQGIFFDYAQNNLLKQGVIHKPRGPVRGGGGQGDGKNNLISNNFVMSSQNIMNSVCTSVNANSIYVKLF